MVDTLRVMPKANETFARKLTAAVKRHPAPATHVAEKIGVGVQSFYQYMSGSTPKPAVLFKLARVLEVDLAWLMDDDDTREGPIKAGEARDVRAMLKDVRHGELVYEMCRRMRLLALDLREKIERVEECRDLYTQAAINLYMTVLDQSVEASHRQLADVAMAKDIAELERELHIMATRFDLDTASIQFQEYLPPEGGLPASDARELTMTGLLHRYHTLRTEHPALAALSAYQLLDEPPTPGEGLADPERAVMFEAFRQTIVTNLLALSDTPEGRKNKQLQQIRADIEMHRKLGKHSPFAKVTKPKRERARYKTRK